MKTKNNLIIQMWIKKIEFAKFLHVHKILKFDHLNCFCELNKQTSKHVMMNCFLMSKKIKFDKQWIMWWIDWPPIQNFKAALKFWIVCQKKMIIFKKKFGASPLKLFRTCPIRLSFDWVIIFWKRNSSPPKIFWTRVCISLSDYSTRARPNRVYSPSLGRAEVVASFSLLIMWFYHVSDFW